jgi:hypothetical protein
MMTQSTEFIALMAMSIVAVGARHLGEMGSENLNPLYPRFMFGTVAKRQAGTECEVGEHSCRSPVYAL